jgi:tetratricopeptide (TPR) repeat protein
MKKHINNEIVVFSIIGLIALLLRVLNILSISDQFYANLLSDASTYRLWASKIAAGLPYGERIFPMGPLYPYFLAIFLKTGFSFYSVLFIQAILGSIVVVLIGLIARRIYGKAAGFTASIITAIYGPFVFYDGLLLSESLQIFLVVLALFLIIPQNKKIKSIKYFLGAGILLGFAALGRGTILLFPIMLIGYFGYRYLKTKTKHAKKYISRLTILIAGLLIGIAPATIHNLSNGDAVLISSNFGINFYIGNNPDATGSYDEPSGLSLSSDFTGRKIAEKESGRKLKSSEISKFWSGKSFDYIKNSPGDFISGLLNKIWLYVWHFDIPQAESIHIQKNFSPLFYFPFAGFAVIFIFAIIGFIFGPKDDNIRILIILFISNFVATVVFFALGRFRLIGAIPLLIITGGSIPILIGFLKSHNWRKIGLCVMIILITTIVLILPRSINIKYKIASSYDNVGILYYFANQFDKAEKWYRNALDKYPDHSKALNNLGAYFYTKGNVDSSLYYFNQALKADPESDKSYLNLGKIMLNIGQLDSARFYFEKAKEYSVYGTDAIDALDELNRMEESIQLDNGENVKSFDYYFNIAEQYSAQANFALAESNYLEALKIRPDDMKALNNLGFTYQAQSKFEDASVMFTRVLKIYGENAIVYNNLASVLYRMNNIDSSIILWEKALKLEPDNVQIINNLNHARKAVGNN